MTEEQASLLEFLREMRAERAARAKLASPEAEVGAINSDMEPVRSDLKSDSDSGRAALAAVFFGDPQGFERADR
jgi:hypothetical protein